MLITISDLNTFQFKIPSNDVEKTNFYNELIESASSIISNYIGMDYFPTQYTEYMDEIKAGRYVVLKKVPIISVDEVQVNGVISTIVNTCDSRTGIIRFEEKLPEQANIKIIYTAGYETVPNDLKYACVELVQYLQKRMSNSLVGESSKNIDGGSITIETSMPLNVLHILNRYKWKNICV